jgi:hypothetical protein
VFSDLNLVAFVQLMEPGQHRAVDKDLGIVIEGFHYKDFPRWSNPRMSGLNSKTVNVDGAIAVSSYKAVAGRQSEDLKFAVFERKRQFGHECPLWRTHYGIPTINSGSFGSI